MNMLLRKIKDAGPAMAFIAMLSASPFLAQNSRTALSSSILQQIADIPLPGPAVRFDYQSLDTAHSRLYIAHMNADQLVVFEDRHSCFVAIRGNY